MNTDSASTATPVDRIVMPLFGHDDEREFKRQFVIHFLAAYEAETYEKNCQNGWKTSGTFAVEDAQILANEAWESLTSDAEKNYGSQRTSE